MRPVRLCSGVHMIETLAFTTKRLRTSRYKGGSHVANDRTGSNSKAYYSSSLSMDRIDLLFSQALPPFAQLCAPRNTYAECHVLYRYALQETCASLPFVIATTSQLVPASFRACQTSPEPVDTNLDSLQRPTPPTQQPKDKRPELKGPPTAPRTCSRKTPFAWKTKRDVQPLSASTRISGA